MARGFPTTRIYCKPSYDRLGHLMEKAKTRLWDLWQVETALACNLNCVMCPWLRFRREVKDNGLMDVSVWNSLVPYLDQVGSVDFTGGGEPTLNKNLVEWMKIAGLHGCETGFLTNGLLLSRALSEELIRVGFDWLAVSIDGADKATYETIRRGADFDLVCGNIKTISELRGSNKPLLMLNFVIMENNIHQLEDIVRLASKLGVDQVNFKQCDVIRFDQAKGLGLFTREESKTVKQHEKKLNRVRKLARKLRLETTAYSFIPDEQPVCDQNPRKSMFIGYDGFVSPCINLAMGGPTEFMGAAEIFPTVQYGNILRDDLKELWTSEVCLKYRNRFHKRSQIHDKILSGSDTGSSLLSLRRAFQDAIAAMPEAPEGCGVCHYLYGV